ncbi:MAG: hypothetical protein K8T26_11325 [Lentisphaerae bacterium]|nr:hypothetical protein [Lentisphaerota bacterium]
MTKFHTIDVGVYGDVVRNALMAQPQGHSAQPVGTVDKHGVLFVAFSRNGYGKKEVEAVERSRIPFRRVVIQDQLGAEKLSDWMWKEGIKSIQIRVLTGASDWKVTLAEFKRRMLLLELFVEMLLKFMTPDSEVVVEEARMIA